ncbi:OmpA family protein [Sphingomonas sp. LHG3406-1]|uniref:OmpA family protein n=1 Tax=Sphingomonas sp. LHG3406-1 TaxID=2804617 RepID=UPI00262507A3|nr:OmpA family protein [Sphingomonas sp. LHG3406-1]
MVITFLAAAAAQATAPSPAPLMIFFDSGKEEIRRDWEPVLDQAAEAARGGARLRLTGHTDREGPAIVNRRISLQRARMVAQALVKRGVPAGSITTIGQGEEALLVPTDDGVREIQNRRVDIGVER